MGKYSFEEIVTHLKTSGFVYQGSEIYGGLSNSWDFGILGAALKKNIKDLWWKEFVEKSKYNVGIDSAILMNSKTWEASGHLKGFSDSMVDCKECKSRFRADNLIEESTGLSAEGKTPEEMDQMIEENNIVCPKCGKHNFTNARPFNLMFKTFIGTVEDSKSVVYLRPETAQGIFVNFNNVLRTSRKKLPFGIGQIGKSFRNEITPGNFIFRVREFEQMELEFFCKPGEDMEWYRYWVDTCVNFVYRLGIRKENIRVREHEQEELSFYSKGTSDIEYAYPFTDWGELWGIADRTDYDLSCHSKVSGKDLSYLDPETNERYIPYCVEPSVGVERLFLALCCDAYDKERLGDNDERIVMHFKPALAPVKVAVLPLSKKLSDKAYAVFEDLNNEFRCEYDEAGSIGKRYRRNDAIGTPFCVTYDFDSENDESVTVRHRDSMEQERVKIADLKDYIRKELVF
ncbi:MAG: glycine--tRNA ligase [Solobacterium sp.]|nr:glycine--tRNA ligase [Erysipelotrichaceae bacterium]MCI6700118.1 glycine--tRNA ligase [Solobacterium sp.]MCI7731929.1 glycine--tRNA ligase [Solobacterium sp.]MDD5983654.1 glycine--tRNA ligase [Solobacterium sp.]MDD6122478.1 glycine--tRNA ligase [Solobacterium sp.]